MKATSVCDFGRNLEQDVVLHVSRAGLSHCGLVVWEDGGKTQWQVRSSF
jgi:hypothetical protein